MSEEQAAQFLGHTAVTDNDYFHWQLAFPEVFFDEYGRSLADAAGFDAVIGNPPYARIQILSKEASSYFSQVFGAATGSYDLYVLFIEKGIVLLNDRGLFGYIVPNKFFRVDYGVGIRRVLSSGGHVKKIVDFGTAQVFGEEATTYTSLLFLEHTPTEQEIPYWSLKGQDSKTIADMSVSESWMQTIFDNDDLGEDPWNFHGQQSKRIIDKLAIKSAPLGAFTAAIARGLSTGNDSVFVVEVVEEGATISRVKSQVESTTFEIENTLLRIPIFASDFQKYSFRLSHVQKVICPYDIASNELLAEDEFRDSFPLTWSYLSQHEGKLRERAQYSKWYGYSAPRNLDTNTNANFLIPLLAFDPAFSPYPVPQTEYVLMASGGFGISVRNDLEYHASYLIALINSRLLFFVLRAISNVFRGGYITCTKQYFEKLPVLEIDFSTPKEQRTAVLTTAKTHYEQGDHPAVLAWATAELAAGRNDTIHDLLAFLAEQMIAMNKEKQAALEAFWLDLEGFTDADTFAKLRDKGKWEQSLYKAVPAARPFVSEESRSTVTLDASLGWGVDAYKGFVKDLAGTVKGLSHIVGVYHDHAPTVGELNGRLADTDALIDQLVYKLYGLNAEEIAIVEGRG